ncbi:hypothetical protein D9757_001589 [Collybiopsis confluens]|uniref:Uncharacterized protein n=1 Tax=Collybiopsis confluens TaxID=2823264 RepID=A0A8H5MFB4_9AGAR|nr:hypothetical protein D9757_001589 [Collybiopsis confluens]
MDPESQAFFVAFGQELIANTTEAIIAFFAYGVFLLEACITVYFLMNRPKGKRRNYLMIIFTAIIFCSYTWEICVGLGGFLTQPKYTLIKELNGSLEAQSERTEEKTLPWAYMESWVTTLVMLSGDCIVAWRAYVLLQHARIWRMILCILALANIALNIVDCVIDDLEITRVFAGDFSVLDWLSTVLSLSVNLFATSMIAWKAWNYHKIRSAASIRQKSRALRIMLLLIESGAIFCVVQAVYFPFQLIGIQATAISSYSFRVANLAVGSVWTSASALYPITVFILIQTHNSPVAETVHLIRTRTKQENDESPGMDPQDQEFVAAFGRVLISNASEAIIAFFSYGVFLLEICITVYFLMNRSKGKRNYLMIICTAMIFCSYTWETCVGLGGFLTQPKYTLIQEMNGNLEAQNERAYEKTLPWAYMESWVTTLITLLGDFIVAWRAYILLEHARIWRTILCILVLANIALNIVDSVIDDLEVTRVFAGDFSVLDWLSTVLSLSVNLLATSMIAWKAWNYHKVRSAASIRQKSRALRIMLLLIESGAIFCVIQAVYFPLQLIGIQTSAFQHFAFEVANLAVGSVWTSASALYPITVFILIQTHNSPVAETAHWIQTISVTKQENDGDGTNEALEQSPPPPPPANAEREEGIAVASRS